MKPTIIEIAPGVTEELYWMNASRDEGVSVEAILDLARDQSTYSAKRNPPGAVAPLDALAAKIEIRITARLNHRYDDQTCLITGSLRLLYDYSWRITLIQARQEGLPSMPARGLALQGNRWDFGDHLGFGGFVTMTLPEAIDHAVLSLQHGIDTANRIAPHLELVTGQSGV